MVRRRFLGVETLVGLLFALGFLAWLRWGGEPTIDSALGTVRGALYGALAAVDGALLGFIIATLAILMALVNTDSPRMSFIRQSAAYPRIWTIFTSTIRWMAASTAIALAALLLDHEHGVIPDFWVEVLRATVILISVVAALRLATAIWILEQIVLLVNSPLQDRPAHDG